MKHNEPNNTPPPASTGKAAGAVSRISIEATEAINSHELAGYILALHFPEEIKAPRQKRGGGAINRYDIALYWGRFPEPLQSVIEEAEQAKEAVYFRLKSQRITGFDTDCNYSLDIRGKHNLTSLEPMRGFDSCYFGTPERKYNRGNALAGATYIIGLTKYRGLEAVEIITTTKANARELGCLYASGGISPIIEELRRCGRVRPMQWQFESECYRTFWGKLHNRPAPQGRTRTQVQKSSV